MDIFLAQIPEREGCSKLGRTEIQAKGAIAYMEQQTSTKRNLKKISNFRGGVGTERANSTDCVTNTLISVLYYYFFLGLG